MEIEDLTVEVGKRKMVLSKSFLINNNALDNLEELKEKFRIKFELFGKMDDEDNPEKLKGFAKQITENEFKIQKLFNFAQDIDFHRWWEIPKCKCPHMDNQDCWGTSRNYMTSNCPIHWEGK